VLIGEPFTSPQVLDGLSTEGSNYDWLVLAYEKQGLKFLEALNGWFSGALIDLRQQRVVLFNDRFGLQRIYYHQSDTDFYFASQAKALLRVRGTGDLWLSSPKQNHFQRDFSAARRLELDIPAQGAVAKGAVFQTRDLGKPAAVGAGRVL
jgi:asparagine synthetase B (glutamine-hydrolysing)